MTSLAAPLTRRSRTGPPRCCTRLIGGLPPLPVQERAALVGARTVRCDDRVAASRAKAPWEDEPEGCLEPGENKLMLGFIGMDKEVAMLRRFT